MKSNSIFQVPAVLMAGLLALGLGTTGCPDPETTPADAGEVDAGPGDAGEQDAGPQVTPGDTCEAALELVPGVTETGDTTGLNNDYQSDCGGDGAPDIVYTFTIDEASGVEVTVQGEGSMDPVVHFMTGACLASDVVACADDPQTAAAPEVISFGLLDPGTYFVVVDGYGDSAGAFTIDLNVVAGGICVADAIDADAGNDTVDTAVNAYLGEDDLTDTSGISPTICEGDVDWYIFGHMGGTLAVDATALDTEGTLGSEVFGATVVFGEESVTVTQGDSLGATPVDQDAPRGYYLARFDATDLGQTGLPYTFSITHACLPDGDDAVLPEQDDEVYERAAYDFYQTVEEADAPARIVCGTDTDVFGLSNIAEGDIVVTLLGAGTGATATFSSVEEQADGTFVLTEITEGLTTETVGDDLVLTLTGAAIGKYAVSVSATDGATTPVEYAFAVAFSGIAQPPANDLCADSETVTLAETETPVSGRTVGAAHDIVGPCGGEQAAVDQGKPGAQDVFYALNVAEQSDVKITFDGGLTDFFGQVYVLQAQAECPADLSTLVPLDDADAMPVCATGTAAELWLNDLPAGDYLIVVDGIYFSFFGMDFWTEGGFDVSATVFPDGFPEPEACVNADTLELPAAGASETLTVDNTDLTNDFDTYPCSGGGGANDKVYAITPAADATVTVTATGLDTLLAIRTDSCLPGVGPTVACNDDVDPENQDYTSSLTADLTAGTTYYLFVDGYSADEIGPIEVVVSVQ